MSELIERIKSVFQQYSGMGNDENAMTQEIIDMVLDEAIKAVAGACGNSDGSMYDYQAVEAIRGLKNERD